VTADLVQSDPGLLVVKLGAWPADSTAGLAQAPKTDEIA